MMEGFRELSTFLCKRPRVASSPETKAKVVEVATLVSTLRLRFVSLVAFAAWSTCSLMEKLHSKWHFVYAGG